MLEYEIGGARDGWLNRMNFLSPLDEWEFLEKREPPLSLSLSLPQMGSKSRLLEWGSSVSINFDKPCVEFESTRLSSTMRVKNNRDELADEIYIYTSMDGRHVACTYTEDPCIEAGGFFLFAD